MVTVLENGGDLLVGLGLKQELGLAVKVVGPLLIGGFDGCGVSDDGGFVEYTLEEGDVLVSEDFEIFVSFYLPM